MDYELYGLNGYMPDFNDNDVDIQKEQKQNNNDKFDDIYIYINEPVKKDNNVDALFAQSEVDTIIFSGANVDNDFDYENAKNTLLLEDVLTENESLQAENNELIKKLNEKQQPEKQLQQIIYKLICVRARLNVKYNEMEGKYNAQSFAVKTLSNKNELLLSQQEQYKNEIEKLKQMNYKLIDEQKEFQIKYNEMEKKYTPQKIKLGYTSWSEKEVAEWIININNKRFGKYYNELLKNMINEGIDGTCLKDLEKNDLRRLGITQFKDKRDIFNAIQEFINKDAKINDNNNDVYIAPANEGGHTNYIDR